MSEHCPTCGQAVRITSTDEGTNSFEPPNVPCSERLPDEYLTVLGYGKHTEQWHEVWLQHGLWWGPDQEASTLDTITHWREMPAPPRSRKANDADEPEREENYYTQAEMREVRQKLKAAEAALEECQQWHQHKGKEEAKLRRELTLMKEYCGMVDDKQYFDLQKENAEMLALLERWVKCMDWPHDYPAVASVFCDTNALLARKEEECYKH